MITFTKEQLIASAHARIEFAEMMLAGELEPLKERTWSIELELARIALASLNAEIHSYTFEEDPHPLYTAPPAPVANINPLLEFAREYIESWDLGMAGDSSLLASAKQAIADSSAHQPAPVSVPDEIEPTVEAIKRVLPTSNPDEYAACIGADMWNACRAAMLQGAVQPQNQQQNIPEIIPANTPCKDAPEHIWLQTAGVWPENGEFSELTWCSDNQHQDDTLYVRADVVSGNSPVIPDGWVACSERMPDGMQTVITSNGFDIGQGWWDGEGWNSFDPHDVVPGDVTHWMPLPAAPQQEVK